MNAPAPPTPTTVEPPVELCSWLCADETVKVAVANTARANAVKERRRFMLIAS